MLRNRKFSTSLQRKQKQNKNVCCGGKEFFFGVKDTDATEK
jgi:hypothetical protein